MEYVQVVAGADGRAEGSAGPYRYGEQWLVRQISTTTTSSTETQLRIYRGVVSDSALIMSTYSGNQDTAGGSELTVYAGDKLVFVWSGANPGARCTARIEGDIKSQRR